MPLYSDSSNYYYSGGSSQLYSPYYSSSSSATYPSYTTSAGSYGRAYTTGGAGGYVVPLTTSRLPTFTTPIHSLSPRYQPKLTTITEASSPLVSRHSSMLPLTRIQSPKYTSYSYSSSTSTPSTQTRYIPPRPIAINTADIDVSSTRYHKHTGAASLTAPLRKSNGTTTIVTTPPDIEVEKQAPELPEVENSAEPTPAEVEERRSHRPTICRNRAVVRLSTIRTRSKERDSNSFLNRNNNKIVITNNKVKPEHTFKDLPLAPEPSLSWRQKLAEDLAAIPPAPAKKTPGELLRERFLIQNIDEKNQEKSRRVDKISNNKETVVQLTSTKDASTAAAATATALILSECEVGETIRRLSIVQYPSFHDICEDISSDKIDDDLNAGELRRRASIIQEQEQEILNQLQKSTSGNFQLVHLKSQVSCDRNPDEAVPAIRCSSTKKQKSKKMPHKKPTAADKQENVSLIPITPELNDDLGPTLMGTVETVTDHKVSKPPNKKKNIKNALNPKKVDLPEGFVQATTKVIRSDAKRAKATTFISTAEIFTFDDTNIKEINMPVQQNLEDDQSKQTVPDSVLKAKPNKKTKQLTSSAAKQISILTKDVASKNKTPIETETFLTALQTTTKPDDTVHKPQLFQAIVSLDDNKPTVNVSKKELTESKSTNNKEENKQLQSKVNEMPPIGPKYANRKNDSNLATPKAISQALQKSESGEDFWSQIGSRESIYMTNRKKTMQECKEESDDFIQSSMKKEEFYRQKNSEFADLKTKNDKTITSTNNTQKAENITANRGKSINDTTANNSKVTTIILNATNKAATTSTMLPASPKINYGLFAKSPEQQQKQTETSATINETTHKKSEITKMETGIETLQTIITQQPTTAMKTKTQNKAGATVVNVSNKPQTETKSIDASANSTKLSEANNKKSKVQLTNKTTKTTTTTTSCDIAVVAETTKATFAKNKTSTSALTPINADQFIAIPSANLSHATSTSPTKKKDASSIATKSNQMHIAAATTKSTATLIKKSAPTTRETHDAPTAATTDVVATQSKITMTDATVASSTCGVNDKCDCSANDKKDKNTIAHLKDKNTRESMKERATANANAITKDELGGIVGGDIDGNGGGNANSSISLSKFATVSNLAQCLRDVDAELDDYIPSSAGNSSDDQYDFTDGSTKAYSSPDGSSHLSDSMKKKKQRERRNKEKKAKQATETPHFDPHKKIKINTTNKCYVKEEAPRYPLVATPRPLWKREKIVYSDEDTEDESNGDTTSEAESVNDEETDESEECTTSEEYEDEGAVAVASGVGNDSCCGATVVVVGETTSPSATLSSTTTVPPTTTSIIRMSTCSNDSGFEGGTAPSSPKKMLECDVNCHKKCERLTANLCGVNQKLIVEALNHVKRDARETGDSPTTPPSSNPAYKIEAIEEHDETSYTYSQFQKSGRFTAPATVIPRFKNYSVDDFHFLAVLGKGSFGKVLLAELRETTYYYAVKCLKKDVVLEDDDVDSTLIERKVLALGTKHPYLCHLFCTFQTESHLFFVMEYLNGGDLMFHIQESGRFSEERARFYGAEIISGLKFLHKKGIIYRDLKLDNVLLDYEGHVRIADFGMCKLQIYLDKTADSFCGTPDYMAPEIIKGEKYNQNVDWWSFGVLLYEMLIGQSPFSGCDEDELFWSICNEIPWFPVYISAEATGILKSLLEKDYTKRLGSQYSAAGDISDHIFFKPIDWNLLEKRQIEPPFKPQVKHPLDTQYFDRVFTRERVRLTPIDKEILASMDQKQFHGFTYTNPHITLD